MNRDKKIEIAKDVFNKEIEALKSIRDGLDEIFVKIEETLIHCKGKVVLCGMGKSGHIANKISATLASLGIPSFFLHPAEAMHGDLGMVASIDAVVLISNSGETQEILRLIPSLKVIGAKLICITGREASTLAGACEIVQILNLNREACYLELAPTSSTTATLVYGDALAIVASVENGFTATSFGLFHPAGTLGKRVLTKVKDIMAKGDAVPSVKMGSRIIESIMEMSNKGLGVVAVVDESEKIVGILTDGDLRRAIEKRVDLYRDIIDVIMTKRPKSVSQELLAVDALKNLKESRLNNYPVVDVNGKLIGMLTWQMIIREGIVV